MVSKEQTNKLAALGIALMPLGLLLWRVIGSWEYFGKVNDLPEYSTAARLAVSGQAAKIYNLTDFFAAQTAQFPSLGARNVALFLPPFDVPLLLPLALIPDSVAPYVWTTFLFVCLCGGLWTLARYYELSTEQIFWFCGLTFLTGPCIESVRIGQLSPILLLALGVVALLVTGQRYLQAGLVLTLLALKPQQMWPLVVFMVGAGKFSVLKSTIGAGLLLVAVSYFMFGVDGYKEYLACIRDPRSLDLMAPAFNATVRGQLLRFVGAGSPLPNIIGLACLGASTLFVFLLGRRCAKAGSPQWLTLGFVGAMPIGLVTSMHCHDYDLLLLAPSLVPLFVDTTFKGTKPPVMTVLALVLVLLFAQPVYTEIHYSYMAYGGVFNPYFWVLLLLGVSTGYGAWKAAEKAFVA